MNRLPWFETLLITGLGVALIMKPPSRRVFAAPPQQDSTPMTRIESGPKQKLGDGLVWSWARCNEKGEPITIGIAFTEAALKNLPTTGDRGMACCQNETLLQLPSSLGLAPFTHIALNWNPFGHAPDGVYDKPHFDFHFYMMDESTRQKIAADDANFAKAPPAECVPAGHIPTPGVMKMGVHWVDPTSPELNGKTFTKTFLYGAYAGKVSFIEPMITKAYLESHPNTVDPIKQPKAYPAGVFPTAYSIQYHREEGLYTIALEGLTRH
jgi:hypothetical protein